MADKISDRQNQPNNAVDDYVTSYKNNYSEPGGYDNFGAEGIKVTSFRDDGDNLDNLLPIQEDPLYHRVAQRASLRYHPHVLYKKASLKPMIGQNGKITIGGKAIVG